MARISVRDLYSGQPFQYLIVHHLVVEEVQVVQLFEHATVFRAYAQLSQIIRVLPFGAIQPDQEITHHHAFEIRHVITDSCGYEVVSSSFSQWNRLAIVGWKSS